MNEKHGRKVADVSEAVLNMFQTYSCPQRRELRNTLERAVIVCESGLIETKHLPPLLARPCARSSTIPTPFIWSGHHRLRS